jgi:hypothetical protein
MSARTAARRRYLAVRMTAGALVWSIGLVLVALFVPVYGSSETSAGDNGVTLTHATLVQVNGPRALALMAIPAVVSIVVAWALRAMWAGVRWSVGVAWAAVIVLAAETVVGIVSVGIFILPVTVLLAAALRLAPESESPGESTAETAGDLAAGT